MMQRPGMIERLIRFMTESPAAVAAFVATLGVLAAPVVGLAADSGGASAVAYRDVPGIGSRNLVWIVAQLHLLLAGFVLGDHAFVHHHLHARVVARVRQHFPAAHQIKTRVAGMRPVGNVMLNYTGHAGGARRIFQVVGIGKIDNRTMCIVHRFLQEQERAVSYTHLTLPTNREV